MWDIDVTGKREHITVGTLTTPRNVDVSGYCRTKADVYKLVDKLCEALGIPDGSDD